jgi:hypothetical protein
MSYALASSLGRVSWIDQRVVILLNLSVACVRPRPLLQYVWLLDFVRSVLSLIFLQVCLDAAQPYLSQHPIFID